MVSQPMYFTALVLSSGVAVASYFLHKYLTRRHVLLENSNSKFKVVLVRKDDISHDTRRFRFALQNSYQTLGLPCGQHIYLNAKINDKLVIRPYTPTSNETTQGYFELVVKIYKAGVHPKFPEGGKMSQYLDNLSIGDSIDIRGPSGNLVYQGNGMMTIKRGKEFVHLQKKKLGLIAGGTGITPMFQIIQKVLDDGDDKTKLNLLFANQSVDDILIRGELDFFQKMYPNQFKVWYTVDHKPKDVEWKYDVGFVNEDLIKKSLPSPAEDSMILTCGPPPMIKFAVLPNLEKLGYDVDQHFEYSWDTGF